MLKPQQQHGEKVNERIRAREILVIDENGEKLGNKPTDEALRMAREKGLDLVEISPNADPPVCRIMDYGKFRYQQSKKAHQARRRQHQSQVKEIKFRLAVDEHDFEFKKNHVIRFLQHGDKVKLVLMFRGRERTHREIGRQVLMRVVNEVAEYGVLESSPKQDSPHLQMVLAPKAGRPKPPKPAPPAESGKKKKHAARAAAAEAGAAAPSSAAPGEPDEPDVEAPDVGEIDDDAGDDDAEGDDADDATDAGDESDESDDENPNTGDSSAETQDEQGSRQAIQADRHGQGEAGQGVQVAHPDQEDAEEEAEAGDGDAVQPGGRSSDPTDAGG